MKDKRCGWMFFAAAVGGIFATLIQNINIEGLSVPFVWLGEGLRALSLGGVGGNIVAWAVVLLLSAIPLVGVVVVHRHGTVTWVEGLLALASVQSITLLYLMVNPTQITHPIGFDVSVMYVFVAGSAIVSTLIGYGLLKGIQHLVHFKLGNPSRLFFGFGLIFLFLVTGIEVFNLMAELDAVRAGNVMPEGMMFSGVLAGAKMSGGTKFTESLLIVLTAVELIPTLATGLLIVMAGDLFAAIGNAPFEEETVAQAQELAKGSWAVAVVAVVLGIGTNLVQVMLFSRLHSLHILINVPLMTLVVAGLLLVMSEYAGRGKVIQEEINSII